ncbi:MAG TPA: hypothetical protein VJZ27_20065, partial [Aggregatilineales bacterium]|nr:hypothetical protein [Aggregatilineales bacterium]
PRGGAVLPDGSAYIFVKHESPRASEMSATINMISLPPDESPPIELAELPDFDPIYMPMYGSMSQNGEMFIFGYLLRFAQE